MAQLLIRNLDPEIIEYLKERARQNNRSLFNALKGSSLSPSMVWVEEIKE